MTDTSPGRSRRAGERGQSLVETALVLPVMLMLLVGIADLAIVYASMITVESGAREAADWGAYRPGNWDAAAQPTTVGEMERRSCTPARSLTGYAGAADGSDCTNPTFACDVYLPANALWVACDDDAATACSLPERLGPSAIPCKVRVRLTYTFSPLVLPTITFTQSSVFNVADAPTT
jgi:hypothetical protein